MSKLKLTLFQEITLSIVVIFILIGACLSGYFGRIIYKEMAEQYLSKGIAIAKSIADESPEIMSSRDISILQSMIDQLKDIQGVSYICIRNYKGEFIAHTFVPEIPSALKNMPVANRLIPGEKIEISKLSIPKVGLVMNVSSPILIGQLGTVHVGMDISIIRELIKSILIKAFLIILLIFGISIGIIYRIIRRISTPIENLKKYTLQLSKTNFIATPELKSLLENIETTSKNEVHDLATAFHQLNDSLELYIQNLKITTAEKNKIESELSIARDIQFNMLPKLETIHPSGSLIHAYMNPATEVGGDFYDVIELDDSLILTVGDVSGHGVPAALTMAICISLIRAISAQTQDPSDILFRVNQELCRHNESSMFITVFLCVLNKTTGHLDYCLAGHPAPYILSSGTITPLELTNGIPLGIDIDFQFDSSRVVLQPNDHLISFSDGVIESDNPEKELYGESRLETLLVDHYSLEPKALCEKIVSDMQLFANSAPQADDITLLHIKWLPQSDAEFAIGDRLKVDFINDLSELETLQKVVELFCNTHQLSSTMAMNINLILEELLTNIIFYGYQDHAQHVIYMTFEKETDHIKLTIEDDAIAFNPLEKEDVDIDTLLEDKPIGGLGIHFVRHLTQTIEYERSEGVNILRMVISLS